MEGESVIALGNAFGYEHTVTRGIISALGRDVQVSDTQTYDDLIQTDASINPGNSGGPLMNVDGEMIGLNVAVRAGAQGIGFAIPVDQVMTVAAQLLSVEQLENKRHGLVTHAANEPGGPLVVDEGAAGQPGRGGRSAGGRRNLRSRPDAGHAAARPGTGTLGSPDRREDPAHRAPQRRADDDRPGAGQLLEGLGRARPGADRRAARARSRSAARATAAACGSSKCGPTAPPPKKAFGRATSWSACTAGKPPRPRTSTTS